MKQNKDSEKASTYKIAHRKVFVMLFFLQTCPCRSVNQCTISWHLITWPESSFSCYMHLNEVSDAQNAQALSHRSTADTYRMKLLQCLMSVYMDFTEHYTCHIVNLGF